jgi:hypothetical protein
MSFNPAAIATVDRPSDELPLARWLGLIALLAAEVFLLTLLFEPYAFAQDGSWSSIILRNLQYIPRMAVVVAVTVLVFGRRWLQSESARLSSEPVRPHRAWFFLACHLIAFIGVTALSAVIFGKSAGSSALRGQLLLLWGLACLATFVFWANSLLPFSVWLRVVRRGSGVLVGLGLVGVAACQMGPVVQSLWQPPADRRSGSSTTCSGLASTRSSPVPSASRSGHQASRSASVRGVPGSTGSA